MLTFSVFKYCVNSCLVSDQAKLMLLEYIMEDTSGYIASYVAGIDKGYKDVYGTTFNIQSVESLYEALVSSI